MVAIPGQGCAAITGLISGAGVSSGILQWMKSNWWNACTILAKRWSMTDFQ
jgi:hypothetical protein